MNQEKLNPYFLRNFGCDRCDNEYHNETAYSPTPSLNKIDYYHTYCSGCVVIEEKSKKQPIKTKKTKDFGMPPQEASENLRSLEIDKRTLRKTNRVHQFVKMPLWQK